MVVTVFVEAKQDLESFELGTCYSAMQEAPEKVVSFPRTTFMKEIGHGSSPGKVSCLTTTFMKDFFT